MNYGNLLYLCVNEEVLMMKKDFREKDLNSKFYAIPGGKIEGNEKGIKKINGRRFSVMRESDEETGLVPYNPKFRGSVLFDNSEREFPGGRKFGDFYVVIFSSNSYTGTLKSSEEGEPIWVPKNEVLTKPMHEGDRLLYEWIFQDKPFSGVIYHKGNKVDLTKSFVDFFYPYL